MTRLKKKYQKEIAPKIAKKFNLKNVNEVPKITKVTVNVGVGDFKDDKNAIKTIASDITQITGQKTVIKKAKKAIAGFKIKQGDPVGIMVTLRGDKMYDFVDRLANIALPRIRDFRGLKSKAFDKNGNYSLGLPEQIIFPEIQYDKVEKIYSLEVSISTDTTNREMAQDLLAELGFPFKDKVNSNKKDRK